MIIDAFKVEFYGYYDPARVIGYHIVEDVSKVEANEFAYNMVINADEDFIVLDSGGIRISDIRSFSAKRHLV